MSAPLEDIYRLFFPRICPGCGASLPDEARTVCTACRIDAPLTGFERTADNPVAQRFWGLVPIANASAFMYYTGGSHWTRLVYGFKYGGLWRTAKEMGMWYGAELKRSGLYEDVDTVVPVPLHFRRRLKRGYNQSEYIARGIAASMQIETDCRSLRRTRYNRSQTKVSAGERWDNVKGIFRISRPDRLAGRHVLLVDDVFTTGATLIRCAETLAGAVPGIKISVAALFVSRKGTEIVR